MLALRPSYADTHLRLRPSYSDSAEAITVVTDFDSGNVDPATVVITDTTSNTPTIYADVRSHAAVGTWRHFLFAVENAEGKSPLFRFNRATKFDPSTTPTFIPYWTQDFVTWTQAPARTLVGGSTGTIEWSFTDPLPAGRVYIASHPIGRLADVQSFVADMLANQSDVWQPLPSADSSGVFATSPVETDDLSRAVGGNPMYAIKASWSSIPTTDGLRKRKLVMLSGIHAAGEQPSWVMGRYALDWMMFDESAEAQAFRANFDIYWYGALSPNAIKGGAYRRNFRNTRDPNRDWFLDSASSVLAEIKATEDAIVADTGGAADAMISWHGFGNLSETFIIGSDIEDASGSPSAPAALFKSIGTTIFGAAPRMETSGTSTTECWWAKAKLGAKISFDAELQQNGDNSLATIQFIGESWAKTLQAVDAAGYFVQTHELSAASLIATTATGSLTTGIALQGAASSMTLAEGVLTIGIRLRGDALSSAIAAAGLTTAIQLAAAAQAGAQASGDLTVPGAAASLEGHAQAQALAAGAITTIIRLDAQAVASVVGTGTLTAPGAPSQLAADATVLAIASGGLTTAIALQGAAASVVQASGTLDLALTFEAAAFASAMASGVLSTQVRLDGAAVAGAIAAANLSGGTTTMLPPAERIIPVRKQVRMIPVEFA